MDRIRTKHRSKQRRPRVPGPEAIRRTRLFASLGLLLCLSGLFFLVRNTPHILLSLAFPGLHAVSPPVPAPQQDTEPLVLPLYVDVDEGVGKEVRITVISEPKIAPPRDLTGDEPKILIYHTHNTEAYTKTKDHPYEESGSWRTYDNGRNIVAVGERLTELLRDKYGLAAIHDTRDHEPPKLSTAYNRSLETMLAYKKQYPSLVMFIDVHRDAGGENTAIKLDGKKVARLMFVVGTGEGATGTGFGQMPDFESNYALALAISNRLGGFDPKLIRNIRIKTGRYNQHVSNQCLLVEVGDNMNTFEEAMNAIPYLAQAIAECAAQGFTAPASPPPTPRAALWAPGA